jgi:hypothetical protein
MSGAIVYDNPDSVSAWQGLVKRVLPSINNPDDLRLSHLPKTKGASGLTLEHFLCLRVLWKEHTSAQFKIEHYVDALSRDRARERVKTRKCREFFDDIARTTYRDPKQTRTTTSEHPNPPYREDSIFSLVRTYVEYVFNLDRTSTASGSSKVLVLAPPNPAPQSGYHRDVTPESPLAGKGSGLNRHEMEEDPDTMDISPQSSSRSISDDSVNEPEGGSPAQPTDFAPTDDEMIVNMAFILLLNALTEADVAFERMRTSGYRWVPSRDVLRILKSSGQSVHPSSRGVIKNKLLEARTDGSLRRTEQNLPVALVEVKPYLRSAKMEQIQWQEGAQMAAYIYTLLFQQFPPFQGFGLLQCTTPSHKR